MRPVMATAREDADSCGLDIDSQTVSSPFSPQFHWAPSRGCDFSCERRRDAVRYRIKQQLWLRRKTRL